MTPQEFAIGLNNAQRGDEISPAEEVLARENRLVVIFGYSDDLIEFRGAIRDEVGSYKGATVFVHPNGYTIRDNHDCNCGYCNYVEMRIESRAIEAQWATEPGYSWTYKTGIPHATFEILDGAEPYCRGIVFSLDDIKAV